MHLTNFFFVIWLDGVWPRFSPIITKKYWMPLLNSSSYPSLTRSLLFQSIESRWYIYIGIKMTNGMRRLRQQVLTVRFIFPQHFLCMFFFLRFLHRFHCCYSISFLFIYSLRIVSHALKRNESTIAAAAATTAAAADTRKIWPKR